MEFTPFPLSLRANRSRRGGGPTRALLPGPRGPFSMSRAPAVKRRALARLGATADMPSDADLFGTHCFATGARKERVPAKVNISYANHLYAACPALEWLVIRPAARDVSNPGQGNCISRQYCTQRPLGR